jgi:hypothetical protein
VKKHVETVGALRIGYGICGILATVGIVALARALGLGIVSFGARLMELRNIVILGSPVALLLVICAVADIVGGSGVLKRKQWARYLVMVRAAMDLFVFPVGTALGIYSVWGLMQDYGAEQAVR